MGSESNKDSRIKKGKTPNKLVFAKDKKQAILAIVVVCIFLAKGVWMVIDYFIEQNKINSAQQTTLSPTDNNLSQQQQNLESMTGEKTPSSLKNTSNQNVTQEANNIYSQTVNVQKNTPNQNITTASSEGDVEIIAKKTALRKNNKLVEVDVTNLGRQNPFQPEGEVPFNSLSKSTASVPYLLPPPENLPKNTDAVKIMKTSVSGILYDKYSPSAIINIEGTDYLVKNGDVINNYKILSINKSQVVIQLGRNIYQAGVGEVLSQSGLSNMTANLNKKFGGNNISISVKKKGY